MATTTTNNTTDELVQRQQRTIGQLNTKMNRLAMIVLLMVLVLIAQTVELYFLNNGMILRGKVNRLENRIHELERFKAELYIPKEERADLGIYTPSEAEDDVHVPRYSCKRESM